MIKNLRILDQTLKHASFAKEEVSYSIVEKCFRSDVSGLLYFGAAGAESTMKIKKNRRERLKKRVYDAPQISELKKRLER